MTVEQKLKSLYSLEGKVILLTGAAGGIGANLAKGMAEAGGTIALCDVRVDAMAALEAEILSNGGKAKKFELDLLAAKSIKSCVASVIMEFGQIDALINNAARNRRIGVLDADEETFDSIIGVNFKGAFFLSQEVARHMVSRKNGSIVNIVSSNAVNMLGGCGLYGATKGAMAAITRAQAIELAKHGIRANSLSPGSTRTPLTAPVWSDSDRSKYLRDRIAMARPAEPDELLGMTILLCSDASSYMTGTMYHVDGGYLAGGQPWPYETAY